MRIFLSMIVGGLIGCLMGYLGRYYSEAPLMGNPVISIFLGALVGLIIILGL